ncbi:MAG TPA: alanine--glyoxylate aminotransferase family protein [bacterium]|nr:alanine--glyoxylate aminotransferase family protein [bacterium]HOL35078.1 alanine--glyoxylate aminotransferase family protein [bacterium]HPP07601.1 alanine--glyoxylate aminotransferase family protein [bacterium]
MMKKRLFTPGPISVPEDVLLEMAKPIIHHRTPEFLEIAKQAIEDLKYFFQTKNDVFIIAGSGTAAMEAAVVNVLSPGEKALVISAGKFGERFVELVKTFGAEAIVIEPGWGNPVDLENIKSVLKQNRDIKAVFATLVETSTGTSYDIEGLGKLVSDFPETLLIVDGISGLGAVECKTDLWGIDILVSGSQKALSLPPGLSFISISEKAWEKINNSSTPRYYLDLKKYKKAMEKFDFPFTMAVSLVCGLKKSLEKIKQQGIENLWRMHRKRAMAVRGAAIAMGLEIFSKSPSDAVTAIVLPHTIDGEKFCSDMRKEFGMSVAGGQDKLKGRVIRISHFGYQDDFDTIAVIAGIEVMLKKYKHQVELGSGVKQAMKILFSLQ